CGAHRRGRGLRALVPGGGRLSEHLPRLVRQRRRPRDARRCRRRTRSGSTLVGLRSHDVHRPRQASRAGSSPAERRGHRQYSLEERRPDFSAVCFSALFPVFSLPSSGVPLVIDVNALIGPYPFRHVPHPDPEALIRVLDREQLDGAWVGHLPSAFYRDPSPGNAELLETLRPYRRRLRPVPTVRPDWPKWESVLADSASAGAPAVRAYPSQWGLGPHDASMRELALAAGEHEMALILTVRFEDLRQRHAMDSAPDLSGATIRALARAG